MGHNPSYFKGDSYGVNLERPVEMVSFYDAILFCNKRSKLEGLDSCYIVKNIRDTVITPGRDSRLYNLGRQKSKIFNVKWNRNKNGYRLPTANESEYALRACSGSKYYWGRDISQIDKNAWYAGNTSKKTHEVATKESNKFGLYDMNGNVWEWCWDKLGEFYRAKRGASFSQEHSYFFEASHLGRYFPWDIYVDQGFRCVRNAEKINVD
jgi:formylglycine-generating enzyme required for sulfatase activity